MKDNNMTTKVFEVRTSKMIPDIKKERFVFELHDDGWNIHFAAASNYNLQQLKQVVEIMEKMPEESI